MKVNWFKKPSRKTKAEEELIKLINSQMEENSSVKSAVDAYISDNGAIKNLEGLTQLKKHINDIPKAPPSKVEPVKEKPANEVKPKTESPTQQVTPKETEPTSSPETNIESNKSTSKYSEFSEAVQHVKENVQSETLNFDVFEAPVIKRSYTNNSAPSSSDASGASETEGATDDIPTTGGDDIPPTGGGDDIPPVGGDDDIPSTSGGDDIPPTGGGDDIPPAASEDDIPEANYNNTEGGEIDTSDMGGEDLTKGGDGNTLGQGNLKDLSEGQKKKAIAKTADVIMSGYARYAPMPFKALAKFPKRKIDLLILQRRINPHQIVEEDVNVKDYIKNWNEEVDKVFTPSQETLDEIREPLLEVLMEQEMALTPQQRLMIAVGQHLAEMTVQAVAMRRNNKDTIAAFVKNNNLPKSAPKRNIQSTTKEEAEIHIPEDDDGDDGMESVLDAVMNTSEEAEDVEVEEVETEEINDVEEL